MSSEFAGRVPTLWHGRGVARQTTTRLTAGRETLVIADSSIAAPVLADRSARTIEVDARSVNLTAVVEIAEEIARRPPSVIVAVGGEACSTPPRSHRSRSLRGACSTSPSNARRGRR